MNRRGFIRFFGKGAAAGAIAGAAKIAQVEAAPEKFEYRGFTVEWTGWKQSHDSDRTVGQWLAKRPQLETGAQFGVYACYPGGEGQYHDYWAFDTGVRQGQVHIDRNTPESVKNSCKEDARKRVIVRIDQALAPPSPPKQFSGPFGSVGPSCMAGSTAATPGPFYLCDGVEGTK